MQVPLGTVVHKLHPVEEAKEGEEPFTFQQHWIGARDYVSSEEEASDPEASDMNLDSPDQTSPSSPPNSQVIRVAAYPHLPIQATLR